MDLIGELKQCGFQQWTEDTEDFSYYLPMVVNGKKLLVWIRLLYGFFAVRLCTRLDLDSVDEEISHLVVEFIASEDQRILAALQYFNESILEYRTTQRLPEMTDYDNIDFDEIYDDPKYGYTSKKEMGHTT